MRLIFSCAIGAAALLMAGAATTAANMAATEAAPQFVRLAFKVGGSTPISSAPAQSPAARLGAGWTVTRGADGRLVATRTPGVTESSGQLSVGKAWEAAHSLRADPSVLYADPQFNTPVSDGEQLGPFDCVDSRFESGSSVRHIKGALGDPEWSLGTRGANVFEAWNLFKKTGRTPGVGVVVAQPDTGYRRHPEIWDPAPAKAAIHPEDGWDFYHDRPDPYDELTAGFLKNPGHGTRTSSVIVSPPGSQRPASKAWTTGVAPGAHLIPLRVTPSVVMLDMGRLADAVRHAAGPDRTRVKRKANVISISLGGPPSRDLRDALRFARAQDVIVVAAAGNEVTTVVWPARYPETVAVAASNYDSGTWKGSSRGSAVAITAPGETVWCASSTRKKNGSADETDECLAVSNGTSFATATTAGIAALWLSYHDGSPKFEALRRQGLLASTFDQQIRAGHRPVANWDAGRYGRGIVDARKVLELELPDVPAIPPQAAAQPADSGCEADLETALTLFDEASDRRVRLERLLRRSGADICTVAYLADEIAFQYAINSSVRERINALSQRVAANESAYRAARNALRSADISSQLRGALGNR